MKRQFIVYFFALTLTFGSLLSSVHPKYAIGRFDDWIAKRSYQRRSFLKSFCAARCNIGQGGNVCKCNGFHFAGKRSGSGVDGDDGIVDVDSSLLRNDVTHASSMDNTAATTDVIYKMLEDNNRLIIDDDRFESDKGRRPAKRHHEPTNDNDNPTYRKQLSQNRFDPVWDFILRKYMYNEDQ